MKVLQQIFLSFAAVLILLPSAVSFSHIFSGHGHDLCDNYAVQHFHKKALDCELYKFQKIPALRVDFQEFQPAEHEKQENTIFNYYRFLSDFKELPFELRGPPTVI